MRRALPWAATLPSVGVGSVGFLAPPFGQGPLLAAASLLVPGRTGTSGVFRVEWSPDGRRLATLDQTSIKVWDAGSGEEQFALSIPVDPAAKESRNFIVPEVYFRCGWVPDSSGLGACSSEQASHGQFGDAASFLDAATGKAQLLMDVLGEPRPGNRLDGERLALADEQRAGTWGPFSVTVLDAVAGRMLFHFQPPVVESMNWSSDSRRLLVRRPTNPCRWPTTRTPEKPWRRRPGDGQTVDGGGQLGYANDNNPMQLSSPDGRLLARRKKGRFTSGT